MKEIVKLLVKYQFTLFFITIEIVCCSLIIRHNHYQRTFFSNKARFFFNIIDDEVNTAKNYFALETANRQLISENLALRNQLELLHNSIGDNITKTNVTDSVPTEMTYVHHPTRAINVSCNKTKNYITIIGGEEDGLGREMAVLSSEGVVGMIKYVGANYSTVLPLINIHSKVSAKLKSTAYYGSLEWDGADYRYSYLHDIPYHVQVNVGDTIVTSGFSYIFPENELIGYVDEVNHNDANFLLIKVRLAVDFKAISNLYVIENKKKALLESIEATNE